MNDINKMPPKCQYCPYWEVCEYPWVCPDIGDNKPDLQPTCNKLATDAISRSGVSAWLANRGYRGLANKVMDEDRFPSVQPECSKEFVMLKVRDLNGRPYYSIIYLEEGCEHEGYASYDLMVISEYLKRYFGFAQPEIIYCRECRHWYTGDGYNHENGAQCELMHMWMGPDDYCSYGRRKVSE